MGLLDDLKKQAEQVKAQESGRTQTLQTNSVMTDIALKRAFQYLNDLGKQLNVVQPPRAHEFKLPQTPDIGPAKMKEFFCDYRSKNVGGKDYVAEVAMAFRIGSDQVITVKKKPEEMERYRDLLWQYNIEHKSEQIRNERKVINHEIFNVPCWFRAQAKIDGDHETGRIKIITKNVGEFEINIWQLTSAEFNEQAIEEFAKFLIGQPNTFREIAKKSSLNNATGAYQRPKL